MLNITIDQLRSIKASEALQAMVDGLRANAADPLFEVSMDSFGERSSNDIYYGCAATCAIASLNGELYSETVKDLVSEQFYGFDFSFDDRKKEEGDFQKTLRDFECAMDEARQGGIYRLLNFVGETKGDIFRYNDRFYLSDNNWEQELPKVEVLIRELREAGL